MRRSTGLPIVAAVVGMIVYGLFFLDDQASGASSGPIEATDSAPPDPVLGGASDAPFNSSDYGERIVPSRGPETPREWREDTDVLENAALWISCKRLGPFELQELARIEDMVNAEAFAKAHWAPTQERYVSLVSTKIGRDLTTHETAALQRHYFTVEDDFLKYMGLEFYRQTHPDESIPPSPSFGGTFLNPVDELSAEDQIAIHRLRAETE